MEQERYFYYTFQSNTTTGARLQVGPTPFDWRCAKNFLREQGFYPCVCTFFKELTKEEYEMFKEGMDL
jgi:hypothetical protein